MIIADREYFDGCITLQDQCQSLRTREERLELIVVEKKLSIPLSFFSYYPPQSVGVINRLVLLARLVFVPSIAEARYFPFFSY